MKEKLNELALFAGVGGGILGGLLCGFRTVCAVEINSFCRDRLMQRQNEGHLRPFPIWDDVRTFDARILRGRVDVVTGGFPCQKFSSAARGRNNAEDFWPEYLRIVADVAPRHVLAENVSLKAIEQAAADLAALGYFCRIGKFTASELGADHIRTRYWVRAYADDKSQLLSEEYAEVAGVSGFFSSIWQTDPRQSGVVDGVADRMERFRAIGNGQVPGMVKLAWETLKP